ncbi:MAG: DegT/DnrJ/EryC1/StrS family aminotransferase [Chloroflexi bacterium]|nr:DegT/DnrJ/EryC1/StrS family aminotransferase [Chloroflexota bacterium]
MLCVREKFLPFAQPDVSQAEIDAVSEVIASGWWTTGPKVREFEQRFADYVGAKHAVAVNSATAAMHLALEAIGLERGDEVITTAYTFAATAEVIRYFDATPILVDIDPVTLNIDVSQIESAVTEKTKAILPVHVAGQAADLDAIQSIADKHGLYVIEDAAHALPTLYKGKMIGSVSDFTAFSFYVTKTLATGEGGMITTDNDEWANRCHVMCLHGISKDAWKRYTSEGSWYYEIIAPGFKYNLTDIAGALGLVQLERLGDMNRRRQEIATQYNVAFAENPAVESPALVGDSTHPYHLYILRLNLDTITLDRNQFINELRNLNIGTSVHWIPLHIHPYYRDTYGYVPEDFPVAYGQYQRVVSLPIYSAMSDEDVEDVISAVDKVVKTCVQ